MSIIIKNALVEIHHSIDLVEYYHGSLCWVYFIITIKILDIKSDLTLQMFLKSINNSAGPNKLVPILLIFDAYLRMIKLDVPSISITLYIMVIKKAINKVRKCTTLQQINDILNTWNRLFITSAYNFLINLLVLVYQESNTSQIRK